ncbi:MAG: hypothetical protein ACI9PZ_002977 [Parvicella sp.]
MKNAGEEILPELQGLFIQELGWDQKKWDTELARYIDIWKQYYSTPAVTT